MPRHTIETARNIFDKYGLNLTDNVYVNVDKTMNATCKKCGKEHRRTLDSINTSIYKGCKLLCTGCILNENKKRLIDHDIKIISTVNDMDNGIITQCRCGQFYIFEPGYLFKIDFSMCIRCRYGDLMDPLDPSDTTPIKYSIYIPLYMAKRAFERRGNTIADEDRNFIFSRKKIGYICGCCNKEFRISLYKYWILGQDSCPKMILNKCIITCMKNYGVSHHFKDPGVRKKIINSYLQRYGVDHPLKCPEIFEKWIKSCYGTKLYLFDTGETLEYQGYEHFLLKELENLGYEFSQIVTGACLMPKINYELNNREHRYYPDIRIKNWLMEVKSAYTFITHPYIVFLKLLACIKQKFFTDLAIFDGKGNSLLRLEFKPKQSMTLKDLIFRSLSKIQECSENISFISSLLLDMLIYNDQKLFNKILKQINMDDYLEDLVIRSIKHKKVTYETYDYILDLFTFGNKKYNHYLEIAIEKNNLRAIESFIENPKNNKIKKHLSKSANSLLQVYSPYNPYATDDEELCDKEDIFGRDIESEEEAI